LTGAVALNVLLLGAFKYANFFVDNLNALVSGLGMQPYELAPVHLPIGISFFTFQALTYVVDVYRRDAPVQRDPLRVALYISLFPQLIAGPIVRYRQVAAQLEHRAARIADVAAGLERFVIGLGKKVVVANTLAAPADAIFAIPAGELEPAVAWLGLACYALQIYFDFAGYSDMAIGLGRCFGFTFPENFDWPYVSRSLREFWRRWHMSLSTWFRDYLYIPLGGNRRRPVRTVLNLFAVFLLCGLWHGASWNFVIWGAIHGAFLSIERTRVGDWLARAPRFAQQLYTLGVVLLAWVFFRADDLSHSFSYLSALFGLTETGSTVYPLALYIDAQVSTMFVLASLSLFAPVCSLLDRCRRHESLWHFPGATARLLAINLMLILCGMSLVAGTHNPFIYFRF
jgi:alginate O-acetyltransferase complex protein AlgI